MPIPMKGKADRTDSCYRQHRRTAFANVFTAYAQTRTPKMIDSLKNQNLVIFNKRQISSTDRARKPAVSLRLAPLFFR